MNIKNNEELPLLIEKATAGDEKSLETILLSVQDLVFNLSLRMLGSFPDAEDAAQEILLKVIAHLSSFRKESSFTTWVFSIASNHLKNYKNSMFARHPLSFEFYGYDIENGSARDIPDLTQDMEKAVLAEELKMSCTNVMLQCLDTESRCIFILGTMFKADSRIAGEILGITPEAYRQRLRRVRRKMADFLEEYCGEYGHGTCRCKDRVSYAIQNHRLNPSRTEYTSSEEIPQETLVDVKNAMEDIDGLADRFRFWKAYRSPDHAKRFIRDFLRSTQISIVNNSEREEA